MKGAGFRVQGTSSPPAVLTQLVLLLARSLLLSLVLVLVRRCEEETTQSVWRRSDNLIGLTDFNSRCQNLAVTVLHVRPQGCVRAAVNRIWHM